MNDLKVLASFWCVIPSASTMDTDGPSPERKVPPPVGCSVLAVRSCSGAAPAGGWSRSSQRGGRSASGQLGPAHRQPPVASVANVANVVNVVRLGGRTGMRDIDRGSRRLGAASVGVASCARSGGSRVFLEHRSINRCSNRRRSPGWGFDKLDRRQRRRITQWLAGSATRAAARAEVSDRGGVDGHRDRYACPLLTHVDEASIPLKQLPATGRSRPSNHDRSPLSARKRSAQTSGRVPGRAPVDRAEPPPALGEASEAWTNTCLRAHSHVCTAWPVRCPQRVPDRRSLGPPIPCPPHERAIPGRSDIERGYLPRLTIAPFSPTTQTSPPPDHTPSRSSAVALSVRQVLPS